MQNINNILKKSIPHFTAILVFIVISGIYFSPQLKGYLLRQSDVEQYIGMSKEIYDYRAKYDEEPLWTNSAFGGMPAYQISTKNSNLINSLKNYILKIMPRPIGYMFFLMIGFYILLLCFNVNPWLAIIGSIAFGLSSINILYLGTGHNAKVHAISFIPPIAGSIIYAYRKNFLTGSAMLSFFTCLHLSANHVQMTYYMLYLIIAIVIVEFYSYMKNNLLPKFFKISMVLLLAGVLGVLPTISNLIVTYEYGKHTIRGKSELTISADNKTSNNRNDALDSDYIKQYSLGFGEIWSLAIPNIKGGSSGMLGNNKEFINKVHPDYRSTIAQYSSYWGDQYSSGGAFYFGASIFLLFVLGIFFVKDKIKWALLAVSLLAIILSWKYSHILDMFIKYVPLFNKFRDTKMMLILVQLSFPLLGFLFLNNFIKNGVDKKRFLYVSLGISSLFLLFYMIPATWFDFLSKMEIQHFNNQLSNYNNNPNVLMQIEEFKKELIDIRIDIFKKDCLRSLFFILATATIIYLVIIRKLRERTFLLILSILVLVDLWSVDKRYLNNEKKGSQYKLWVDSQKYKNPFKATVADNEILKYEMESSPMLVERINEEVSKLKNVKKLKSAEFQIEQEKIIFRELNFSTNYRVFSILNPFISSRTSYFHKSLGGYHGAKLKKYNELIDFHISREYAEIYSILRSNPTREKIQELLKNNIPVLNMLNTKYIIYQLSAPPIINPYHYGNSWFVDNITYVVNADEEILSLKSINSTTAILNEKYKNQIPESIKYDSTSTIQMESYKPNHLTYKTSAQNDQLAVFSEIFYEDGWNAYLDGNKKDYFKANYLLRAMNVPAGNHIIEFKFEPESYYTGRKLSFAGSGLIIIFILGILFQAYRSN